MVALERWLLLFTIGIGSRGSPIMLRYRGDVRLKCLNVDYIRMEIATTSPRYRSIIIKNRSRGEWRQDGLRLSNSQELFVCFANIGVLSMRHSVLRNSIHHRKDTNSLPCDLRRNQRGATGTMHPPENWDIQYIKNSVYVINFMKNNKTKLRPPEKFLATALHATYCTTNSDQELRNASHLMRSVWHLQKLRLIR